MELTNINPSELPFQTPAQVEAFVEWLTLQKQDAECELVHHFGEGVYIRELTMPKGAIVAGFNHVHPHTNVVLRGRMTMYANGQIIEINGPTIFNWGSGRKIGHIHEETVWQNIHAIDTDDLDEIESYLYKKTPFEQELERGIYETEWALREDDRIDFYRLGREEILPVCGEIEQIPEGFRSKVHIRKSQIDGKGLFLSKKLSALEVICPLRLNQAWTKAAQFLNHSIMPSAFIVESDNGDIWLMSLRDIQNGRFGQKTEEITVDYRQAAFVLGGHKK